MILRQDARPLSEFHEHAPEFLQQLKETGAPIILTVDGKAEVIVQDAASYQKMLDFIEEATTLEGIRRGLEDMRAGRTITFEEFKKVVREKHGIDV